MAKSVKLDANGYRKFGMRDCLAYAAGDLGCNMSFALKGTMAIFWTQFMGMDLWYALLLVIVQVWDAINDPLIGTIIDNDKRTNYKRGKFLAYIWLGSIGLLVAGAMCFIPFFKDAGTVVKGIVFVSGYVLWDAFYTIANVPYGSLLSLISDKPADRASLSAWRSVGSLISFESGEAVTYGLHAAQERGSLFIGPGTPVYAGMVVGICSRNEDMNVNVCKRKQLTNMRASGSDEALRLVTPRVFSLEQNLEFLADDELLECTPKSLRIRKRELDHGIRMRETMKRRAAAAEGK